MVTKTRTVNGKMETYDDASIPSPQALERLRKEVKDRIAGNERFHKDEFALPTPLPEITGQDDEEQQHWYGYF